MAANRFFDKDKHPGNADLRKRLGDAYVLFEETIDALDSEYEGICMDWKYSKTSGWYITADRKKERLFYLFPQDGDFTFKMVFNDASLEAITSGGFPKYITEMIRAAKKYPEGTLCELTRSSYKPEMILDLLRIKLGK